jgi:hypothetical protein
MTFTCPVCEKDSGTSMVCPQCIKHLTDHAYDALMMKFHEYVVKRDGERCVYCGVRPANERGYGWDSGELCANHRYGKNARPDLRFDVAEAECVCKICNGQYSSVPHSQMIKKNDAPKNPVPKKIAKEYCKEKGCMLMPLSKPHRVGYCVKHQ